MSAPALDTSKKTERRTARVGTGSVRAAAALTAVALCAGCPGSPARRPDAAPLARPAEVPADALAESIFDNGLVGSWKEVGLAPRDLKTGGPARVRFTADSEWTLSRPGLTGHFGGLAFRVKEPAGEGEFLEVRLGSSTGQLFSSVKLKPDHRIDTGEGWAQVVIPMTELNPKNLPFDRIVLRPFRPFGDDIVLFDKIGLTTIAVVTNPASRGVPVATSVDCKASAAKISPYIYGIAYGEDWTSLAPTARRWGGNTSTRYNWERGVANRAKDWFFENGPQSPYTAYLAENNAHSAATALTVPMIGWVAKDDTSYSFSIASFGPQAASDPYRPDVGNGVNSKGEEITPGPPALTSVAAPPEWIRQWISTIRAADAARATRSIYEYILDNEPMLWSTTHRDVHPDPVGYDELLDRSVAYATAIRGADPDALIAGPAEWGWTNYFDSAQDTAHGNTRSDRLAHGGVPLVEWYLRKMREQEQKTKTHLLDILDLHYYPQASGVYGGGAGGSDRATQLLRLRSTRSLWDPTYTDESWIKDTIRLLPRMKDWVDRNAPGCGISIGEWNFGGERDVTGALATAEVLGRFAQFGVTSAFYWTAPAPSAAASVGFKAYRNFDGLGGHFLDFYVPTTPIANASLFASRNADGKHLVLVAINLDADQPLAAHIDLVGCGSITSSKIYEYKNGTSGLTAASSASGEPSTLDRQLPAWSITVFDVRTQ